MYAHYRPPGNSSSIGVTPEQTFPKLGAHLQLVSCRFGATRGGRLVAGGEHDQLEAKCSLHLGQTPEDSLALGIRKAAALAGPVALLPLSQSWG